MRAYTSVLLASLAIALPASSDTQKPEIGRAELITKDVTGTLTTASRKLKTGDNIHQNEVISTAKESEAEIILNDDTKLAVGPESRIVLDSFVYDQKKRTARSSLTRPRAHSGLLPAKVRKARTPSKQLHRP
jgi:hypothetical protein